MRRRLCSLALVIAMMAPLATTTTGCAATYQPRPSARVSMVMQGGSIGFVREGRMYRGGIFGGQLAQAVSGNEAAVAHARTYRNLTAAGFAATMGGLAVIVVGELLWLSSLSGSGGGRTNLTGLFAALGIGLSLDIAGLIMSLTALPHLYDAMNVYNDDVEFGRTPHPSPHRPQGPQGPGMYIGPVETGPMMPASHPVPSPMTITPDE